MKDANGSTPTSASSQPNSRTCPDQKNVSIGFDNLGDQLEQLGSIIEEPVTGFFGDAIE